MDLGAAAEGIVAAMQARIAFDACRGHLLALGLAIGGVLLRGRIGRAMAWVAMGIVTVVDVGLLWTGTWVWLILEVWIIAGFLAITGLGVWILACRVLDDRPTSNAGPDHWSPPDRAEVERVIAARGR